MELRQLEYFMMICKELHFTRAAEKLHISQPSLSQQIKKLEFELGIPLFDRIGKSIALTEAGKIMKAHAEKVFYELEQAEAALRDLNGLQRGKLRIGSLLTCVNYLLPPAILKFKRLYPDIELSILGMKTNDIHKGLLENKLDLGIGFLPIEIEELEYIPLYTEELSLAVPSYHPFANFEEIELKMISDVPTILLPENYFLRQLIDTYCDNVGVKLNPVLEMSTMESLVEMVAEGLGITILPTPYLDFLDHTRIKTVKLNNPTPKRKVGFIYRKDKFMCTATKTFMDQITDISQTIYENKQEA